MREIWPEVPGGRSRIGESQSLGQVAFFAGIGCPWGIDLRVVEHHIHLLFELLVDRRLERERTHVQVLQFEGHDAMQEQFEEPVPPNHTQRPTEPLGRELRAPIRFKLNEGQLIEFFEHLAG